MIAAGWLILLVGHLQVFSDSPCPSSEAVEAQLTNFGEPPPAAAGIQRADSAQISRVGQQLRIQIYAQGGEPVGERSVAVEGSCQDQAQTVALVLATWEPELSPQLAPSALRLVTISHLPEDRETTRTRLWFWSGAAGAGTSFAGGGTSGWTPLVQLRGELGRTASHWRLETELQGEGSRGVVLGEGQAHWQRFVWEAGAAYQLTQAPVRIEWQVGPGLGILLASGEGFPGAGSAADLDLAFSAGVRLEAGNDSLAPFLALKLTGWPVTHQIFLRNTAIERSLPQVEGLLNAGLVYRSP